MTSSAPASQSQGGDNDPAGEPLAFDARRRRDGIGELLRRTRLSYGDDIEATAAALRIRPSHIEAIEQGRYDQLPGAVYAQGFVRTYAVHLGLDGDEAVRRFKNEAAGLEQPQDLAFPMPLTKHGVPGGRVLLAAFVLAVCGYGLWYYLSTGSHSRPDQVSAVPAQLLPPPAAAPATAPNPPASTAAAPGAPPAPAATAAAPAPAQSGPAQSGPAQSGPAPAAVPPAAPPSTLGDIPATMPKVGEPTVSAVNLPPPEATPAASSTPSSPSGAAPAAAPAAPAPATTPATDQGQKRGQGQVYGAVDGPARIIVRATGDSWFQLRDRSDAIVAQRLLHAGDVFRVPEESGLTLRTGNAAALVVTVDGKSVPTLSGTVHTLDLDPARLLAGTALLH